MIIASNEVYATVTGPHENGKYAGFIRFGEDKHNRLLVSTQPVFESEIEAKTSMQAIIDDFKKTYR
jgi:hypothetical protein